MQWGVCAWCARVCVHVCVHASVRVCNGVDRVWPPGVRDAVSGASFPGMSVLPHHVVSPGRASSLCGTVRRVALAWPTVSASPRAPWPALLGPELRGGQSAPGEARLGGIGAEGPEGRCPGGPGAVLDQRVPGNCQLCPRPLAVPWSLLHSASHPASEVPRSQDSLPGG